MGGLSHKVRITIVAAALAACGLDVAGNGPAEGPPVVTPPEAGAADGAKVTTSADAAEDSAPQAEASAAPDAAPADCDLDNDGHAATACGGDDCCDYDARAQPGATDFHDTTNACGAFDYDCNGKDEREFGKAGKCDQAFSCGDTGFDTDTPCGVDAAFTSCDWLFGCHPNASSRKQRCR